MIPEPIKSNPSIVKLAMTWLKYAAKARDQYVDIVKYVKEHDIDRKTVKKSFIEAGFSDSQAIMESARIDKLASKVEED